MAYVYKYFFIHPDIPIYVGKVVGDNIQNLISRHKAHKYDDWYEGNIRMQYIELSNNNEADTLETYLINYYSDSVKNIAKAGWGKENRFFEMFDIRNLKWSNFKDDPLEQYQEMLIKEYEQTYKTIIETKDYEIAQLKQDIENANERYKSAMEDKQNLMKDIRYLQNMLNGFLQKR